MLPGFETKEEIARMFRVDAEGVDGTFGVGFGVGGEPAFCHTSQSWSFEEGSVG